MKTLNVLFLSCLFGLGTLLGSSNAVADDKTALEHFKRGQDAEKMEDWTDAVNWYEQAVTEHSEDGPIVIDSKRSAKESRAYGRGVKLTYEVKNKTQPYFPNQRLAVLRKKIKTDNPPVLVVDARYIDASGDNTLTPGESSEFEIIIRNNGETKANRVSIAVSADKTRGLRFDTFVPLNDLEPGNELRHKLKVSADKRVNAGGIEFTVIAREYDGFDSREDKVAVNTKGFLPPNLVVANIQLRDNNGNGKIEQVEFVEVTYTIRNIGIGAAHGVSAAVETSENVRFVDETVKKSEFGSIAPGESKTSTFNFYTNKRIAANSKIPLAIRVTEAEGEYGSFQDLKLVMNEGYASTIDFAAGPAVAPVVPVATVPLADIDLNIPRGTTSRPNAIAVVIGNSNYTVPGVPEVTFANRDAQSMKKYLVSTLGFAEENIIYAEDANLGTFNKIFGKNRDSFEGQLFNYADPEGKSDIFVFYSGHGAPDIKGQSAYIVPSDADPTYIADTGYSLDTFYSNLEKVPAKSMTVVIDSCFSGNSDGGFLLKNISPALIKYDMPKAKINKATLLTSSGKDEVSSWYNDKGHGLFTYYFLKGLGGEADANSDKKITTEEVANYVKKQVKKKARRLNGRDQNPVATNTGDTVLATF